MDDTQNCWTREDGYSISTQKGYLDLDVIHQFLAQESYWSKGINQSLVEKQIENTPLCFGVYDFNPNQYSDAKQVGFARVLTDFVKFSYLADVFILPAHRKKGLSKWLVQTIVEQPFLAGTNFHLGTKDAHTLYKKFGFQDLEEPNNRLARPINWNKINEAHGLKISKKD